MHNLPKLTLFHTDGCHLCEQAEALVEALRLDYVKQDICILETLVENYGTRIPVLQRQDNQKELNWPFDNQQLQKFIGA